MDILRNGIPSELFYGPKNGAQVRIEAMLSKNRRSPIKEVPQFMTRILGPSRTWKVFKKQQEAINCCVQRKNKLMCFAFEQKGGQRLFLVAHPKVFWAVNSHRFFADCSTYEIIREYLPCKLYFDIEFEYEYNNKDCIGDKMLSSFLHIVNCNIKNVYGINCTVDDILNLDSSNEKKYSHHIIYQIPNVAFQDNYAVGDFVQEICTELKFAFELDKSGNTEELIKVAEKYQVKKKLVSDLFVYDQKGRLKLFVDEGVYTKNRHFRLLGSTKLHKNSPLVLSQDNKYKCKVEDSTNLNIFLDSLITYFSTNTLRILEYSGKLKVKRTLSSRLENDLHKESERKYSDYKAIDNFILNLISPGGIRKKSILNNSLKIIYEISGYRYCNNIKRHHKSNNIMFIVDLHDMVYYQKCHDPDCANFKSEIEKLPDEVCFFLGDDSELIKYIETAKENYNYGNFTDDIDISEEELVDILSCLEDLESNTALK